MSDVPENKGKCFVIMPISDPDGYEPGHFRKIYEQIFIPAIETARYEPHRADDEKSSHLIMANILEDLINAPMALCDLSTRNPNVLYELGIRHAYNKPVVLVQQANTERIFDITGINAINYRPNRYYDEVIEDRKQIEAAIVATSKNSYSLAKLIKANAPNYSDENITSDDKTNIMFMNIISEIKGLKNNIYTQNDFSSMAQNRKTRNLIKEDLYRMSVISKQLSEFDKDKTNRDSYRDLLEKYSNLFNGLQKNLNFFDNDDMEMFKQFDNNFAVFATNYNELKHQQQKID